MCLSVCLSVWLVFCPAYLFHFEVAGRLVKTIQFVPDIEEGPVGVLGLRHNLPEVFQLVTMRKVQGHNGMVTRGHGHGFESVRPQVDDSHCTVDYEAVDLDSEKVNEKIDQWKWAFYAKDFTKYNFY